jgi:hypothetical protein
MTVKDQRWSTATVAAWPSPYSVYRREVVAVPASDL